MLGWQPGSQSGWSLNRGVCFHVASSQSHDSAPAAKLRKSGPRRRLISVAMMRFSELEQERQLRSPRYLSISADELYLETTATSRWSGSSNGVFQTDPPIQATYSGGRDPFMQGRALHSWPKQRRAARLFLSTRLSNHTPAPKEGWLFCSIAPMSSGHRR